MIRLDPDRRRVHGPRGSVSVTPAEYRLLRALLMAGFNQPVSNADLFEAAWPMVRPPCALASLRNMIYRLRPALASIRGAHIAVYPGAYKIEAIPMPVVFARAA